MSTSESPAIQHPIVLYRDAFRQVIQLSGKYLYGIDCVDARITMPTADLNDATVEICAIDNQGDGNGHGLGRVSTIAVPVKPILALADAIKAMRENHPRKGEEFESTDDFPF